MSIHRVSALAFALALGSTAHAEPEHAVPTTPSEQAEARFALAQDHYRNGRFDRSVEILLELMREFPDPILLYNLARAYEGMGKNQEALEAYERYLKDAPDSEDRGAVEQRVATLRRQIADKQRLEEEKRRLATARAKAAPAAAPAREPDAGAGAWPWILTGAGFVGLGIGTTFAVLAQRDENEAADEPSQIGADAALERGRRNATAANVAFVTGGLLVAGGITWLILDSPRADRAAVGLTLGLGGMTLSARGL